VAARGEELIKRIAVVEISKGDAEPPDASLSEYRLDRA
jgi:hypothetical protein